jgi:heme exporter protein A
MWRGDRRLFAELDVSVRAGRVLHVRGANGYGKTTLLRILSGLLPPEEGVITFNGEKFPSAQSRSNAVVGYLGHADGLKLDLGALENLRFAASISGAVDNLGLDLVMARVGLRAQADVLTRHLSAGQRRRLAIARLCSTQHQLWVLDEPFTALDDAGVKLLCELMSDALERGVGIVMSSHHSIPIDAHYVDFLDLGELRQTPPTTQQQPFEVEVQ